MDIPIMFSHTLYAGFLCKCNLGTKTKVWHHIVVGRGRRGKLTYFWYRSSIFCNYSWSVIMRLLLWEKCYFGRNFSSHNSICCQGPIYRKFDGFLALGFEWCLGGRASFFLSSSSFVVLWSRYFYSYLQSLISSSSWSFTPRKMVIFLLFICQKQAMR